MRDFETLRKSPFYKAQRKVLNFMAQLEEIIESRNISKKELAEKMGVSPAYISKLFNCSVNISIITMEKLAHALKMEINQPHLFDANIMLTEKQTTKTECSVEFTYNNDNFDLLNFEKTASLENSETNFIQQIKIS